MQKTSYDKERELAEHILSKYIHKSLTALLRKGYSSWFFSKNRHGSQPVRQLNGFNQVFYKVEVRSSISSIDLRDEDRERFINIAHYPDHFSQLARPILDDLDLIVRSAPAVKVLTDPLNHENMRRSVAVILKALLPHSQHQSVPLLFLQTKLNQDLTIDSEIRFTKIPHSAFVAAGAAPETENYKALQHMLDELQNDDVSVYEIFEQTSKDARRGSEINERYIHEVIVSALPFLRENELLLQLVEAPGTLDDRITSIDKKRLRAIWNHLLDDEFNRIDQRFGNITKLTKEKQFAIVRSVFQSKFDIPVRFNGSFDARLVPSPDLNGYSPDILASGSTKLSDWNFLRDYLGVFLSGTKDTNLSRRGTIVIRLAKKANPTFFPEMSCSVEIGELRHSSMSADERFNWNLDIFTKMKRAVLIDILRERAACYSTHAHLTDSERNDILDELDARFEKASEQLLANTLSNLLDNVEKIVELAKTEERKTRVKTDEDVIFASILKISRMFLKEIKRLEADILNVRYGKSEYSFPIAVNGADRGEVKFSLNSPNSTAWNRIISVPYASFTIDGFQHPIGPIHDLYSGKISGTEIARRISHTLYEARKDPSYNGHPLLYANESEANILIAGIKAGFDRLYEQEMVKMNQGKDRFYEAFQQEFPEELFEWAAVHPVV